MNAPPTRGIPSKKAISFEYDRLPMSLTARWEYEDVLKLIFPEALQKVQYGIALNLVKFVSAEGEVNGDSLAAWQAEHNVANSTLRNLVIPKLVRVGMLARERRNPSGQDSQDKRHHMILKLSNRFGEAFKHVGSEWVSLVETSREKKRKAASV